MQLCDINEIRKIVLPKHHFHIERNRSLALESPKEEFKNVVFATVKYNIFIKIQSSHSRFVSVITKTKKAVEGFCQKSFLQRSKQKTTNLKDFGPFQFLAVQFNLELSNFIDYLSFAVPLTVSNTLMVSISNRAYFNGAKSGRPTQFEKHRVGKRFTTLPYKYVFILCLFNETIYKAEVANNQDKSL